MSSEVKRYDPINSDGTCGMCIEDADYGAYVEYADYSALKAERERLRAQVSALQSDANSWQSGYDKGRDDGAKAADGWKAQHARDSAELRRLCSERDALRQQLAERDAQIERLQMQLAACGVVALANTPGSAGEARQMHPDYMSGSCSDVADAVDREIAMRQQRDNIAQILRDLVPGCKWRIMRPRIDAALAEIDNADE